MTSARPVSKRLLHVAAAAAVAAAFIGFVSGTRPPPPIEREPAPAATEPPTGALVPRYLDMPAEARGANAEMYEGALAALSARLTDQPALRDEADRDRALAARAERRAYDGAPPTIPHEVGDPAPAVCLSCHQSGLVLAGLRAPPMSHELLLGCVQCHVVSRDPRGFSEVPPAPDNHFVGLAPVRGTVAWPDAPPTTPHPTWMRTECASCHGAPGAPGLRTTHPERESCQQCHAPSAALDQRVLGDASPPRLPGQEVRP